MRTLVLVLLSANLMTALFAQANCEEDARGPIIGYAPGSYDPIYGPNYGKDSNGWITGFAPDGIALYDGETEATFNFAGDRLTETTRRRGYQ